MTGVKESDNNLSSVYDGLPYGPRKNINGKNPALQIMLLFLLLQFCYLCSMGNPVTPTKISIDEFRQIEFTGIRLGDSFFSRLTKVGGERAEDTETIDLLICTSNFSPLSRSL